MEVNKILSLKSFQLF